MDARVSRARLLLLLALIGGSVSRAQAPVSAGAPRKSERTATLLSAVVPGLGQMYAGAPRRGAVLLATTTAAVLVGTSLRSSKLDNCPFDEHVGACLDTADHYIQGGVGFAALVYVFNIYDAHRVARHTNERHARSTSAATAICLSPGRTTRLTVSVPFR